MRSLQIHDGGNNWNRFTFPNQTTVQAVAALSHTEGQIGYMATSDLKLWKTTDAGQTYTQWFDFAPKVEGYITNTVMALVTLDPTDANTLYVGVRGKELPGGYWDPDKGALYKSQDGGLTFGDDLLPHDTDNSWKKNAIYSLAIDPMNRLNLYIGQHGYNNIQQEVMKSQNGGATWTLLSTTAWVNNGGSARVKLAAVPNTSTVWVITGENQGHGVYYSTDGGASWIRKAQPLGGHWSGLFGLAPSLEGNQKVTASGSSYWEHSIAQTLDGNVNWATLTTSIGPGDLARDPLWEERLYAANNNGDTAHGGVIVSYDNGITWTEYFLGWTNSISVVRR
jgi:hypothetical protein